MKGNEWDSHVEYLTKSREFIWNDDYMAFLVRDVWKITEAVRIIDFGCGLGYLAEKLLPLCPIGSSYTGIDRSDVLIEHARHNAEQKALAAEFISADLLTYKPTADWDIAICHTVLQHIPDAERVLEKMIQSVRSGGMVICCEISRNVANAGLNIDGLDTDVHGTLGILQKLWWEDHHRGGSDHTIGIKLPAYMRRLGLKDVQVRVNDFCQFVDPFGEQDRHARAMEDMRLSGWGKPEQDREKVVNSLMARGLTHEEAHEQAEAEFMTNQYLHEYGATTCVLLPLFMLITFGVRE